MMMPANFSAVNAEVVYGGAVADYLPNAWTAESVKRFNSNIITLVSNSFTGALLNATLGTMFSGNWGEDNRIFGDNGSLTALYHVGHDINADSQNFGNKIMTTLGLASVVYSLGMKDAAVLTAKKVTKLTSGLGVSVIIFSILRLNFKKRRNRKIRRAFCCLCYQTETFSHFFKI